MNKRFIRKDVIILKKRNKKLENYLRCRTTADMQRLIKD